MSHLAHRFERLSCLSLLWNFEHSPFAGSCCLVRSIWWALKKMFLLSRPCSVSLWLASKHRRLPTLLRELWESCWKVAWEESFRRRSVMQHLWKTGVHRKTTSRMNRNIMNHQRLLSHPPLLLNHSTKFHNLSLCPSKSLVVGIVHPSSLWGLERAWR